MGVAPDLDRGHEEADHEAEAVVDEIAIQDPNPDLVPEDPIRDDLVPDREVQRRMGPQPEKAAEREVPEERDPDREGPDLNPHPDRDPNHTK